MVDEREWFGEFTEEMHRIFHEELVRLGKAELVSLEECVEGACPFFTWLGRVSGRHPEMRTPALLGWLRVAAKDVVATGRTSEGWSVLVTNGESGDSLESSEVCTTSNVGMAKLVAYSLWTLSRQQG